MSAPDLVVKSTGAGVQSTAIALLIEDGEPNGRSPYGCRTDGAT